jgi:hypothetical protein
VDLQKPIAEAKSRESGLNTLLSESRVASNFANDIPAFNRQVEVERMLLTFRQQGFRELLEQIQGQMKRLRGIEVRTANVVEGAQKAAHQLGVVGDEYLLPLWLVWYSDSTCWEPLLGLCEARPNPTLPADWLRCCFDEERWGGIKACLSERLADWKLAHIDKSESVLSRGLEALSKEIAYLKDRGFLGPKLIVALEQLFNSNQPAP